MKSILISGAEVRNRYLGNRGAEHLLRTAASRLRSMGMQPCVAYGQVDPALVVELGLHQYVGNPRAENLDKLLPKMQVHRLVNIKALDGVLDASGFAMGDAWGVNTARWLLRKYRQWNRNGLPIVALPQAYGSFEDRELASMCREALAYCTRVYPRDAVSAAHLKSLGINSQVLSPVPDITIGETLTDRTTARSDRLVIVPNWNLAARGDSGAYFASLVESVNWGNSRGMEVVGVLHEGRKDLELLQHLRAETDIRILADLTGWQTKEYIAGAAIVVAGRYHAVLAALTTGTPVLTHSWSHKYLEVLRQFDVEDWLTPPDDPACVFARLDAVSVFTGNTNLQKRREIMKDSVDRMWAEVEDTFASAPVSAHH